MYVKMTKGIMMNFLMAIPKRLIASVFFLPLLWLRYMFTGQFVEQPEQEESDGADLIRRINFLKHQNIQLCSKLNNLVDFISHHKNVIAVNIEDREELDEHQKSFCLDVTSSLHYMADGLTKEAHKRFMDIVKPGIEAMRAKSDLSGTQRGKLDKCLSGDLNTILSLYTGILTKNAA